MFDRFYSTVLNRGVGLTTNDLKLIQDVVRVVIDEELDTKVEVKLGNLPTKDEFYEQTDKIMGEIKTMREEHSILSSRVYDNHELRIEKVERKLNISPAV